MKAWTLKKASTWVCLSFLLLLWTGIGADPVCAGERFDKFKDRMKVRFPGVQWISVEALDRWIKEKPADELVLLDTRSHEEFEVSHLEGARLASDMPAARKVLEGRPSTQVIVTYCSVGYRSAVLAEKLGRGGFINVYNLEGSLFEWANKGYPVYKDGKQVHKVHFYNLWWGMYLKKELWAW